ncbi:conserved membrane hypothetical protein [Frankia canadensis]|uniref:Vegetative cell wall protein gp1 n=1 Tax=Frankia canadensis TaxID=1836972 RepID=A0A2I2KYT7_9ACTN|nr:hypothetical protein [Frankia canadensis]SNQ50820.1 conserved membrane hypothetical protein [Frankia canadensis]SOU58110.1 conserved membrane hypothetical protein [Frankia canadensis]
MYEVLGEFGRRIAERSAALVLLPGLVFTAALTVAATVRQRHWADTGLLWRRLAEFPQAGAAAHAGAGSTRTATLLLGVAAVSVGASVLARAVGRVWEVFLLGRWPGLLRPLATRATGRRRRAWERCDEAYEQARAAGEGAERLGELAAVRNRIGLVAPRRPTRTGDRLLAAATRVYLQYALDLGVAWPRLWLLLPESTRTPLTEARQHLDEATVAGGWAVLYTALGVVWWPSTLVGIATGIAAWRRCGMTAAAYAELVEAAVDVHHAELLDRFDEETRPIRPGRGAALTEMFRKGA